MKIIVCIKQVPASSNVKIDPESGVLIRDGKNSKMNPYDLFAIEAALKIKEEKGATVVALSMGPPSAKTILEEALWMGCDDAILVSDRKFGGADVVATSYTLYQAIKAIGDYDIIVCGKQTTDGDTAQVGAEISEHLNIPHSCYINKILEVTNKDISFESNLDKTFETIKMTYPCLITVDKDALSPRLPSYLRSVKYKDYDFKVLSLKDLEDKNEDNYGLKGSPTQVEKMFNPDKNDAKVVLEGDPKDLSSEIFETLKNDKYI